MVTQGGYGGQGGYGFHPQQGGQPAAGTPYPQGGGHPGGGYPYGGPSYGPGQGAPQAPRGGGNGTTWILGGLAAFLAVVLLVAVGVIVAVNSGDNETATAAPSESSATSQAAEVSSSSAPRPTMRLAPGGDIEADDESDGRSGGSATPNPPADSADHEDVLDEMVATARDVYGGLGLRRDSSLEDAADAMLDDVESGDVDFEEFSFYECAFDSHGDVATMTIRVPHDEADYWIENFTDNSDPDLMQRYGLSAGYSERYYYIAIAVD